jgi:protein-disulfide isomerase
MARAAEGASDPLGLPSKVKEKLQLWCERYSRVAPDRKIVLEPEWRIAPAGWIVIRRRLTSSEEKFNESIPILLSQSYTHVFQGMVMKIDDALDLTGPDASKKLSKQMSALAGDTVEAVVSKEKGPAGMTPVKLTQVSAGVGRVEIQASLTGDNKFLFVGMIYSLDADPRKERMKRLDLAGSPSIGPANAAVTIVEISDYECPSCGLRQKDIEAALEKYKGKVRLVHQDHPIWRIHQWAMTAADGSRCVEKMSPQSYWKYKHELYARQKEIDETIYGNAEKKTDTKVDDATLHARFAEMAKPIIQSLGIDFDEWNRCRKEGRQRNLILSELSQASDLNINGTPTLLVNGILIDFGIDKVLDKAIAQALAGK